MTLFVGASESYDEDAWEVYSLKKENAKLRNRIKELESYVTAPPLEEQLLNALDENDKLREQAERLFDKTLELGTENDKLRDLAARMLRTMEWNDRISNSMYWPSLSYKRELRELGVEVGE